MSQEGRRIPIVDKRVSSQPAAQAPPAAHETSPTGPDASPSGLGVDGPYDHVSAPQAHGTDAQAPPAAHETSPTGPDASPSGLGADGPYDHVSAPQAHGTDVEAPSAAREPAPTGPDASAFGLGVDGPHGSDSAPPAPSADAGTAAGGDAPDFPEVVGEAVGPSVAEGEEEKQDFLDDLRRLQADFDNYRKRMMREQAATASRAKARLIERLLPVLDAFDQALAHDEMSGGLELIGKQLRTTLEAEGLEEIPAEGVPFDPHVHEAVDSREDPDVEQTVSRSVYRRGYKVGDQVLRPAMVVVARPVEHVETDAAEAAGG